MEVVSVWGEGTILTTQFSKSRHTPVSWVVLFGVPYLRFLVCSLGAVTWCNGHVTRVTLKMGCVTSALHLFEMDVTHVTPM